MAYLEKQYKNGKYYYYLTQTVRLPDNKFKKIRYFAAAQEKELSKSEEELLKVEFFDEFESILDEYKPLTQKTDFNIETFFDDEWEVFSKEDLKEIDNIRKEYHKIKESKDIDYVEKIREEFIIRHAYDTNKVEGSSFSLEETNALITKGLILEPHKQREVYEITNIKDAFDYIETYRGEFNNSFIKKLHKIITKSTLKYPESEGQYRKKGINVGMGGSEFKTIPGGHVTSTMKQILDEFEKFYKKDQFGSIIRLYSAFIAIHPFIDGNGRTSRMLINYLLMKEGLPPINFIDKEHGKHIKYLEESRTGKGHGPLAQFILNRIRLNHWTNR